MTDDKYLENIARTFIDAKANELESLLAEIKEEDYTTIPQIIGAINIRLDTVKRLVA